MLKAALAGALALVAAGILPVSAQETTDRTSHSATAAKVAAVEARIASVKASLRLRADQERYWPRVAAAIRSYANRSRSGSDSDQSAIKRAASKALHAQRVVSAAAPLIKVLDADQKQTALGLIRAFGFGHLASAL